MSGGPILRRTPAVSSSSSASTSPTSSSARMIPSIPKPNVPVGPGRVRRGPRSTEGAGGDEDEMLPPHEISARESAKGSPITAFSVVEDAGRRLKGRELRLWRVRNVLRGKTDHHMEATSQESRGAGQNKRVWSDQEDLKLIEVMLDLHNMGMYNADNGFKSGFFNALEKILAVSLPQSRFKADPHIRSRVKTLKGHFAFVHDMLCGANTSGFGYDDTTKNVVAEKSVWDAYIQSHKKAEMFKEKPFQYYKELCIIFGKDRATDVHAEIIVDAVEELEREAATVTPTADDDFDMLGDGIDGMDFGTSPDPASFDNTSDVGSSRRKKEEDGEVSRKDHI